MAQRPLPPPNNLTPTPFAAPEVITMVKCPLCIGDAIKVRFVDGQSVTAPCELCAGRGWITPEHAAEYKRLCPLPTDRL